MTGKDAVEGALYESGDIDDDTDGDAAEDEGPDTTTVPLGLPYESDDVAEVGSAAILAPLYRGEGLNGVSKGSGTIPDVFRSTTPETTAPLGEP